MTGKIVFDTNALLGFLKQHDEFPDLCGMFPDSDLFISEITEFELLSYWDITPEEETNIVCLLQDLVIIPFKPEIKKCAINFRRAARCTTPDSIIAATAILLDAELVTRDKKMLKTEYPGLRIFPAGQ